MLLKVQCTGVPARYLYQHPALLKLLLFRYAKNGIIRRNILITLSCTYLKHGMNDADNLCII